MERTVGWKVTGWLSSILPFLLVCILPSVLAIESASVNVIEEWIARYNKGPGATAENANAIAVDASGNIYVTGGSFVGNIGNSFVTLKYDPHGRIVWDALFYYGSATAITTDVASNVYVTGNGDGGYVTIKYNSNGNEEWVAHYNGPANEGDEVSAIAVDAAGNVYVTGLSTGVGTGWDYATIKYDPNGNEVWVARYNGRGNGNESARAIAVDINGNVYVTGSSGIPTGDYATIKYDSDGHELWAAIYNGPGNDSDDANAIGVDSEGNVYVTGRSIGSAAVAEYATIKYDPNGNELWVARHDSGFSTALAIDSEDKVYVTGTDYVTIKYDSSGDVLWVADYDGPGNSVDSATAMAIDASNCVYVTGFSIGLGTRYDYATVKYDEKGNQLWVARYNGPLNGDDKPVGIVLDTFGNVYISGNSAASKSVIPSLDINDFVTIKLTQGSNDSSGGSDGGGGGGGGGGSCFISAMIN